MTRVLGIACSPRRGGNTEILLDATLEAATEAGARVDKIIVPEMDISPCKACDACWKDGKCVQDDDMQAIYPKLREYEGISFASPIMAMSLSAQAKAFIDRLQCFWATKYILKKPVTDPRVNKDERRGLFISTAGMDRSDVFDGATTIMRYFFHLLEIPEWHRLTFNQVDSKGAIRHHPGALERAKEEGRWLARTEMLNAP